MPSPKETRAELPDTDRTRTEPYRVFEKLFDCYHFHEIRNYLNDIKYWLINKEYPFSADSREHDNTLFFFEKMLALVKAVQVFEMQRQAKELALKKEETKASPQLLHSLFDKVDALYDAASYLNQRKQNGLTCYFLHKTVLCIYSSLLLSRGHYFEETSDPEELAGVCSKIFNSLPNPFNPNNPEYESLGLLSSITLQKAFATSININDEQMEVLLRQVAIIRKDVCEYYEGKIQGSSDN